MKETLKRIFSVKNIIALILLILCALMLFVMCKRNEYKHVGGMVFGTVYHITYDADSDLNGVIETELQRIDMSLSLFNDQSTLARLNAGDTVPFDTLLYNVFSKGWEISRASDGCFDMTVAPLVNLWGFGPNGKPDHMPEQSTIDSLLLIVGFEKTQLVVMNDSMCLVGGKIDAAAIAKGYACDVVGEALAVHGCSSYCVEIGGELVVKGENPNGELWHVGVNKPVEDKLGVNPEVVKVLELTDAGMATSGNYRNFIDLGKGRVAHTVNPKTGMPVESSLLSATIVAPDCMTADAWATACMVAGLETSVKWMQQHTGLSAYLLWADGERLMMTTVVSGIAEEVEL